MFLIYIVFLLSISQKIKFVKNSTCLWKSISFIFDNNLESLL